MKSKIFIFTTLILVVFLFVITSCNNFLNGKNNTTININLDLSKILKTSRNETTSNPTEYILKVFAYNAASYKPKDEVENLPLLTQTENKVDVNGNVKARLDVAIGLNVIFVAKLYQGEAEEPIYTGKSEVIKIKITNNKVHLVLTRENVDLDTDILIHDHTFAPEWTSDATHHWHASTCEHTDEKSGFEEHIFGEYVSNNDATTEANGTKTRECSVCGYKDTVTDEGSKIKIPEGFVLIPAGTFQMGSEAGANDDKPVHQVTITKSFYMGKYEVTQAEYEQYCSYEGDYPGSTYGNGDNYPAYYVSWYDALVYCNNRSIAENLTPCYSISKSTDPEDWGDVPTSSESKWNAVICNFEANGYRLPTEAEWEYAARAGDNTVDSLTYSGTSNVDELDGYAWYSDNSNSTTHEVGKKLPNAFGLYDMSGNLFECCWNWKTSSYDTEKEGGSDPTGASDGSNRVVRGGSWGSSANCVVSSRYYCDPSYRCNFYGFRVVRTATD